MVSYDYVYFRIRNVVDYTGDNWGQREVKTSINNAWLDGGFDKSEVLLIDGVGDEEEFEEDGGGEASGHMV